MTEVTTVYDRFTELTKRAMVAARDAATSLGHDFIDTEHLLLGVLAETDGVALRVLAVLGVDAEAVRRSAIERASEA